MEQSDFVEDAELDAEEADVHAAPVDTAAVLRTITVGGKNLTRNLLGQLDLAEIQYSDIEQGDIVCWGRVHNGLFGGGKDSTPILGTKNGVLVKSIVKSEKPDYFRQIIGNQNHIWLADKYLRERQNISSSRERRLTLKNKSMGGIVIGTYHVLPEVLYSDCPVNISLDKNFGEPFYSFRTKSNDELQTIIGGGIGEHLGFDYYNAITEVDSLVETTLSQIENDVLEYGRVKSALEALPLLVVL